ncbi:hypothetical protein TWF506_009163 [Arthrobotrys conoides]|uniref:Protein SSH4 n=1 Tax=Arthrobotrys conoides TaxID=74498 RepID=A0AAN8NI54_9PEZI
MARTSNFTVARTSTEKEDSRCWLTAKACFRERIKDYKPAPKPERVDDFLHSNVDVNKAILECGELEAKVYEQYNEKVQRLLGVLHLAGENDTESCGQFLDASTIIATIILNCRLYENRHRNSEDTKSTELTNQIIEAIEEVITVILEFCWYATRKFRKNSRIRSFRDLLGSPSAASDKYEEIIRKYRKLRSMASIQFEEYVIDMKVTVQTSKLAVISEDENIEMLKRLILSDFGGIQDTLRPIQVDIYTTKFKTNSISQGIYEINDSADLPTQKQNINERFRELYMSLRPSDAHLRQLELTLAPLLQRLQTIRISQWLFENEHYRQWAEGDQKFLYIKGRAGFGKSVTMALAVRELEKSLYHRRPESPCPVIFFFFKREDDETRTTDSAISSLVAQLFQERYVSTIEENLALIRALSAPGPTDKPGYRNRLSSSSGPNGHAVASEAVDPQLNHRDSNMNILKRLAKAIGKTIYIVLDGIDECVDYESSNLISELIELGRSENTKVKILLSSREGIGLEERFGETEANTEDSDPDNAKLYCQVHDDATILTINKFTNEKDMKLYLKSHLKRLLWYKTTPQMVPEKNHLQDGDADKYQNVPDSIKRKGEIRSIVEKIQMKAQGMFTYSTMVIADLQQPSPLSIKRRIKRLPDNIGGLYEKHLWSLTPAQRNLVTLALERVVFAPGVMNTLEIIEQFKNIYLDLGGDSSASSSSEGEAGSEDGIPTDNAKDQIRKPMITPIEAIRRGVKNAEVVYTIRHLEAAGKQFFKFSRRQETIQLISKSVFDWIEKEVQNADDTFSFKAPIIDIFKFNDDGEMEIKVPKQIAEHHQTLRSFRRRRDIYLDILIYNLQVLTSRKFQDIYTPAYYSLENPNSSTNPYLPFYSDSQDDAKIERARVAMESYGDHRGELKYLDYYMLEVDRLWPHNERIGRRWTKLESVLQKFSDPEVFARWSAEFLLMQRIFWDDILPPRALITPGSLAAHFGWEIYLEFLVKNEELKYNLDFDLQNPSLFGSTILHTEGIKLLPRIIELILAKMSPRHYKYNITDWKGETPFLRCLSEFRPSNTLNTAQRGCLVESMMVMLHYDLEPYLCFNRTVSDTPIPKLFSTSGLNSRDISKVESTLASNLLRSYDMDLISWVIGKYGSNTALFDINYADAQGNTVLHEIWKIDFPIRNMRIEILRLLLDHGADPSAQNSDSLAPLALAAQALDEQGVKLLLDQGADIDDIDVYGQTAFMITARLSDETTGRDSEDKILSMLRLLKNRGADITVRAKFPGLTPLMWAVVHGRWMVADAILQMCKSQTRPRDSSYLMQANWDGETLLHIATKCQTMGLAGVKFVIENMDEASIMELLEMEDGNSQTALELATRNNLELSCYFVACYYQYSGRRNESIESKELWLPRKLASRFFWSAATEFKSIMEDSEFMKPAYEALTKTKPYSGWLLHALASSNNIDKSLMLEVLGTKAGPVTQFEQDEEGWDMFDWAFAYGQEPVVLKILKGMDYTTRRMGWAAGRGNRRIQRWKTKHRAIQDTEEGLHIKFITKDELNEGLEYSNVVSLISGHPIPSYAPLFYYEVTINEVGKSFSLGYTVDFPSLNHPVGSSKCAPASFGFRNDGCFLSRRPHRREDSAIDEQYENDDEYIYFEDSNFDKTDDEETDSEELSSQEGLSFGAGDTVGCGYDQRIHEIFWTLNGKLTGVSVTDVKLRLWPIISGVGFDIDTNFGGREFVWKGEREG